MGATVIDKDQSTHAKDSVRVTGQVTFNSAQFYYRQILQRFCFSTSLVLLTCKNLALLNLHKKECIQLVILDKALDRINLERAKLGAIMSRMTKAIDNLSNVSMNTKNLGVE